MKILQIAVVTMAAAMLTAPATFGATKKESSKPAATDQASLQKEAKITMEQARATALKKVPNGTIDSAELEREHGKLIYSFDIKTAKPGVTEVQVDAINGKVVSVKHESAAHEAAEKKKEAQEKTKH